MEPVQTQTLHLNSNRDEMNNELKQRYYYKKHYTGNASDNEGGPRAKTNLAKRNHFKSLGNIHGSFGQERNANLSISSIDLSDQRQLKKFESLQVPIVGYEVMEERARFTIYKLKVEDDKRDKSWLVFRRYTDFVRLYSRIKNELPTIFLPLPSKRWFRDNFDPAFLEERVRGLQIFINAAIAKLADHPAVQDFLCLNEPPTEPSHYHHRPEVRAVEETLDAVQHQLREKELIIRRLEERLARCSACPACSRRGEYS